VIDQLLPRTDKGVLVQAALGAALVAVRRNREWRLLVIGVLTMTAAWFGLRAVH
jgi:hypothetical protein